MHTIKPYINSPPPPKKNGCIVLKDNKKIVNDKLNDTLQRHCNTSIKHCFTLSCKIISSQVLHNRDQAGKAH